MKTFDKIELAYVETKSNTGVLDTFESYLAQSSIDLDRAFKSVNDPAKLFNALVALAVTGYRVINDKKQAFTTVSKQFSSDPGAIRPVVEQRLTDESKKGTPPVKTSLHGLGLIQIHLTRFQYSIITDTTKQTGDRVVDLVTTIVRVIEDLKLGEAKPSREPK